MPLFHSVLTSNYSITLIVLEAIFVEREQSMGRPWVTLTLFIENQCWHLVMIPKMFFVGFIYLLRMASYFLF